MKDYYDILQVGPNAEHEVIEAAYRRLAQKYHPDVNRDPAAAARMRELNEAYEVLGDPRRRAEYDALLRRARARAGSTRPERERTAPPPPPPPPPSGQPTGSQGAAPDHPAPKGRRLSRLWLGVVAGLLLALTVAGATTAAVLITRGQGAEKPATQVYRYAPSVAVAVQPPSQENYCWGPSHLTGRPTALRCVAGDFLSDPCFTYGPDTVICPNDPRTTADDTAFIFDATAYIGPIMPVPGQESVWFMVVNGYGCYALRGLARIIGDKDFSFACNGTLFCTDLVEESGRFVSDCWDPDSGAVNTYTVDAVWH